MDYADLVAVYERLEATEATLELTGIVANALAEADEEHLPLVVKLLRGDPFAAWRPEELGLSSNLTLSAIATATGLEESAIEEQWRETGDLGSAAAWAVENDRQQTLVTKTLTVREVHDTLQDLATYEGEGSQGRRIDEVAGLLADADPLEAKYVVRTVLGHLRLGVGEGIVRDAIAEAFLADRADEAAWDAAVAAVERGFQVTNDYRVVAETARDQGVEGLRELDVELFRPLRVMLAQKAESLESALSELAPDPGRDTPDSGRDTPDPGRDKPDPGREAADPGREAADAAPTPLLEYKLDGFRVQIHVDSDDVTVFTRRLEDVTQQFPDVVERVSECVAAETCILEGEVIGYDGETGDVVPFQELSRRIKRKYEIDRLVEELPVGVFCFDLLYLDGETYLDAPLSERLERLEAILDPDPERFQRMPHRWTSDPAEAEAFYREALEAGQEGLMVKNPEATYQPGTRVGYMVKVKPTMEPLDLTVVRAKWSEGRRSNNLGRLYLACRDPDADGFLEVGRLSTGFTDEELAEVTERLEAHAIEQDGREVVLDPSEVLHVAYEEIQASPEYESGYALRFPRFEGFRDDLGLGDVDTVERVESLYEDQ